MRLVGSVLLASADGGGGEQDALVQTEHVRKFSGTSVKNGSSVEPGSSKTLVIPEERRR